MSSEKSPSNSTITLPVSILKEVAEKTSKLAELLKGICADPSVDEGTVIDVDSQDFGVATPADKIKRGPHEEI